MRPDPTPITNHLDVIVHVAHRNNTRSYVFNRDELPNVVGDLDGFVPKGHAVSRARHLAREHLGSGFDCVTVKVETAFFGMWSPDNLSLSHVVAHPVTDGTKVLYRVMRVISSVCQAGPYVLVAYEDGEMVRYRDDDFVYAAHTGSFQVTTVRSEKPAMVAWIEAHSVAPYQDRDPFIFCPKATTRPEPVFGVDARGLRTDAVS